LTLLGAVEFDGDLDGSRLVCPRLDAAVAEGASNMVCPAEYHGVLATAGLGKVAVSGERLVVTASHHGFLGVRAPARRRGARVTRFPLDSRSCHELILGAPERE
jgi:hypothetical protein